MLDLMYITNKPDVAQTVQSCGVGRIFVDMEYIGKEKRQKGLDCVKNHHTVEDVKKIRRVLDKSKLLVRLNPIHQNSESEIESVIAAGADIVMLPMWKNAADVKRFLQCVDSRAKSCLLLENSDAVSNLDDVLALDGIDEIYIGLNDLHLSMKRNFMFELLADGTVDNIVKKISAKGIPYGFGGIGRIGSGLLPADLILAEHYRLGSSSVILSRTFCNSDKIDDIDTIRSIFTSGLEDMRLREKFLENCDSGYFEKDHSRLVSKVDEIKRSLTDV